MNRLVSVFVRIPHDMNIPKSILQNNSCLQSKLYYLSDSTNEDTIKEKGWISTWSSKDEWNKEKIKISNMKNIEIMYECKEEDPFLL